MMPVSDAAPVWAKALTGIRRAMVRSRSAFDSTSRGVLMVPPSIWRNHGAAGVASQVRRELGSGLVCCAPISVPTLVVSLSNHEHPMARPSTSSGRADLSAHRPKRDHCHDFLDPVLSCAPYAKRRPRLLYTQNGQKR